MGYGWTTKYHKRLALGGAYYNDMFVVRGNGYNNKFVRQTDGSWKGDDDIDLAVTEDLTGYYVSDKLGNVEYYDFNGILLSETDSAGNVTHYTYDNSEVSNISKLVRVTGPYGHTLNFTYNDDNLVESITDASGTTVSYQYLDGNLISVHFSDGTLREYHYEDLAYPHHLTGITDQTNVRFATWAYDSTGKVILSQHAETENSAPQEKFTLVYDSEWQTTVTDPKGEQEVFTFNKGAIVKNLASRTMSTDNKGIVQSFDASNNLTSRTNEENIKTTYTYNASNQRTSRTDAANTIDERITEFEYYSPNIDLVSLKREPSVATGQNKQTHIIYNSQFLPETVTISGYHPDGTPVSRQLRYGYNANGKMAWSDGPRSDVADITTFTYYECDTGVECGQLKEVINPMGQVTTYNVYDHAGRVKQITDMKGMVNEYAYDSLGRITEIKRTPAAGAPRITQISYNPIGKIGSMTTPGHITLTYGYDAAHYLRSITDNLGNRIEYSYDLSGNRIKEQIKDNNGNLVRQIQWAYDLRNNVESVNRGGSITQHVVDAVGRLVSTTDANLNNTHYDYSDLNELQTITDAYSNITSYNYDDHHQLTQAIAPNGSTTGFVTDDLGNVLSETSPDRGMISYVYDEAGKIISSTDARQTTVTMRYDALGRILIRDYPGTTEDKSYTYDACVNGAGQICSFSDETGTTTYSYDLFGNIVERNQSVLGINYTTQFSYDADNRLTQVTYPSGDVVDYSRDGIGRISHVSVTDAAATKTLATNLVYSADHLLKAITYGNGVTEQRSYNSLRMLETQDVGSHYMRTFLYDAAGNLTSRTLTTGNQTFVYDKLNRLTSDSGSGSDYLFSYDANGNRLTETKDGQPLTLSYSTASNRLTAIGTEAVQMDASGNILAKPGLQLSYNLANRLTTVLSVTTEQQGEEQVTISEQVGTYEYNSLGQRTVKISPNGTTVFHYDLLGNLLAETTATGDLIRYYVWLDRTPLAQIDEAPLGGSTISYLHIDHLNTPRAASNDEGNIAWMWETDGFGVGVPNEDVDGDSVKTVVNLRFPGQYYDLESGLHYNYFRTYDPGTGRYVTSDPIGLQGGLNTYAYVLNSPLKFVDPRGLDASLYPKDPSTADPTDFTDGYVPPDGPEAKDIVEDVSEALSTCEGRCNAIAGSVCGAAAAGSAGSAGAVFLVCRAQIFLICKAACPDEDCSSE